MRHLDLFSGIGGFSLAADRVFGDVEHTFVEWDEFCTEVLKKHWPTAEYHKDIREFVADSYGRKQQEQRRGGEVGREGTPESRGSIGVGAGAGGSSRDKAEGVRRQADTTFLLTGGFPCQPFSHAGRRKGTDDDRYLWPPMLECVSLFRPEWVIAENVAGLASWNGGLVLETVCADLEKEGYEVQPFVIPAVAVGAPHRRDRIWIVANRTGDRRERGGSPVTDEEGHEAQPRHARELEGRPERPHSDAAGLTNEGLERPSGEGVQGRSTGLTGKDNNASNAESAGQRTEQELSREGEKSGGDHRTDSWDENWTEVAARLCRVDDGVPRRLDRNPRLKALGNAIVPQVAEQIMRAIKQTP